MKAIKIKPILFKEGNFVYPLFETKNLKSLKYTKKSSSESESRMQRKNKLKAKDDTKDIKS